MNKHNRTVLFTVLTSICNIIITIIFAGGISVGYIALFYMFGLIGNVFFKILLPFVFFGGLVISLKIYMIFARWVIRIFKLDGKLEQKVLDHYSADNERTL